MTPTEESMKKKQKSVYNRLFSENEKVSKPKFTINDAVRICKKGKDFDKGYLPNFTDELFIIHEILKSNPITYRIEDMNCEEIKGSFYEQEMVKYNPDIF